MASQDQNNSDSNLLVATAKGVWLFISWALGSLLLLAGVFKIVFQLREHWLSEALVNFIIAAILLPPIRHAIMRMLGKLFSPIRSAIDTPPASTKASEHSKYSKGIDGEKSYPYKIKISASVKVIVIFGLATLFYADRALNNKKGLIINYIIRLDPSQANVFYWVCCGLSAAFALWAFYLLITIPEDRKIILGTSTLRVPRRAREVAIPYESIQQIKLTKARKYTRMTIFYRGKQCIISSSLMDDEIAFEDLFHEIKRRCKFSIRTRNTQA